MSERHNNHVDPSSDPLPVSSPSSRSSQVVKIRPSPSAPTSKYSYSNTFTMRHHDYSPLSSEEPNSRDISNYNTSPPLFNNFPPSVSEGVPGFFSSMSYVPTSVILPDAPSRPLYSYDPLVGLGQPPPPTIQPANFIPRHFGVPSIMPNHINHHDRQDRHPQDHNYQHHQSLQQSQPMNPHSYPQKSMDHDDFDSPNSITGTEEARLKKLQRRACELEEELKKERSKLRGMDILGVIPPDWEERTRFREQMYCSLNRAGNALCAWHDSRRERPLYAPRMAPHRTLNCGCTYEEAIFEESLCRNGVGSLWPGESVRVRMDPMLRNRLLGLLQRVYRYRDGDFERNPDGTWKEGQSAAAWEKKAKRSIRRKRVH